MDLNNRKNEKSYKARKNRNSPKQWMNYIANLLNLSSIHCLLGARHLSDCKYIIPASCEESPEGRGNDHAQDRQAVDEAAHGVRQVIIQARSCLLTLMAIK